MKKLLLLAIASTFSAGAWADCSKIEAIADSNYQELDALSVFRVPSSTQKKVYFHSAPSKFCKISQTFVIPNDRVIAYYSFNNEDQEWLYVVYNSNNKKTTGWMMKKSLVFIETTAMDD